jgi:methylmalonyl-CoA mutase
MLDKTQKKGEIKLEKEINLLKDFPSPTYTEWKESAEKYLKGAPFEKKLVTKTYEGIELQPIYTEKDIRDITFIDEMPGYNYYVRGTEPEGYLNKSWEICQEIPYSFAEEFNKALKYDLERGQTSISLLLDRATQLGIDADNAKVEEVGHQGISMSSLEDFSRALLNIDLKNYPIHINAGFSSIQILMILAAFLKKQNIDFDKIKGSIEADPIGFMLVDGSLPVSLKFAYDKMAMVLKWARYNMPKLRTIGINSLTFHNSGANAVQELAYVMATAVEYINQMIDRDLNINDIAQSIRLTFGIGPFYFMEVAKIRAARIIWAKIIETYKGNKESQKAKIHARTSFLNQTKYDPYVNILRTTTEAFSAVVGGVDSLHTNFFNECFEQPDEFSRRIARNTQIILNEETRLSKIIDPGAGSYYVEKLTDKVAKKAWTLLQEIENKGGVLKALKQGYLQEQVEKIYEKRRKDIAKRKTVIIGTNMYSNLKEKKLDLKSLDYREIQKRRKQYLKEYKASRIHKKHIEELNNLCSDSENIIDVGIETVLKGTTIGEITRAITRVSGDSVFIKTLKIHRASEGFEEIRDAVEVYKEKKDCRPKLFLANMGSLSQYKARADFSKGFFEVGGFDVIYPKGFNTSEAAVNAALKSEARVMVICSTDETYPELVPPITKAIKDKKSDIVVVLAGNPKDQIEEYRKSGVDEFIYLGADAHLILLNILRKIGVIK